MRKLTAPYYVWLLLLYIITRLILWFLSIRMDGNALLVYWQYLSIDSYQHHLLRALWYDHAQPPVFNLIIGLIVKASGEYRDTAFYIFLHLVSLANVLLIYRIVALSTKRALLAFVIASIYLLSPSTMMLENELFYTQFVSLLLLVGTLSLYKFGETYKTANIAMFVFMLTLVCLTRSIYHFIWFVFIAALVLWGYRRTPFMRKIATTFSVGLVIIIGWYVKNLLIFGIFSSSSWMGMNMARNVFHGTNSSDSIHIENIDPFSPVSVYKHYIREADLQKFKGLNDEDLFNEYKNGHNINENHVAYLQVSDIYLKASIKKIKAYPKFYSTNVIQSAILFFAPATRYTLVEQQARKIHAYDVALNFNLASFSNEVPRRRVLTALSAIPMLCLYGIALWLVIIQWKRMRSFTTVQAFIIGTIEFVFIITSLMEHYENMRFRFEIQPLFLILFASLIQFIPFTRKRPMSPEISASVPIEEKVSL
jgi:hypothetical protein